MSKIHKYKGIKYKVVLGPQDCKEPCKLCEMRNECEEDDFDDYMGLCGDWDEKPYYCIKV